MTPLFIKFLHMCEENKKVIDKLAYKLKRQRLEDLRDEELRAIRAVSDYYECRGDGMGEPGEPEALAERLGFVRGMIAALKDDLRELEERKWK